MLLWFMNVYIKSSIHSSFWYSVTSSSLNYVIKFIQTEMKFYIHFLYIFVKIVFFIAMLYVFELYILQSALQFYLFDFMLWSKLILSHIFRLLLCFYLCYTHSMLKKICQETAKFKEERNVMRKSEFLYLKHWKADWYVKSLKLY